jgi:hypothetical protein
MLARKCERFRSTPNLNRIIASGIATVWALLFRADSGGRFINCDLYRGPAFSRGDKILSCWALVSVLSGLKPSCWSASTARLEQFAEKLEKQVPHRLKPDSG